MAIGLLMPVWTRTPGSPSSTIATLLPALRHRGCARAQYCSTTPPPRGESAYTVGMRRLVPMAALLLLILPAMAARQVALVIEIGRAAGRERGEVSVVGGSIKRSQ